jgi:mono/diheme cytochrome c family protein
VAVSMVRNAGRRRSSAGRAAVLAGTLLAACGAPGAPDVAALEALAVPAALEPGAALFHDHCSQCHGALALGTDTGPPLVHPVYRPAHHGDEAFQIAVARGVRAHHWRFGDMAAVPGLTRGDVEQITAYIRWLQRAAGIE